MRRFLSITLVLLFAFPALAALLPGSQDDSLPICCRRLGVHHCGMAAPAASAPGEHALASPTRCPLFRTSTPATLAALPLNTPPAVQLLAQRIAPLFHELYPYHSRVLTHTDRGPPTAC